MSNTNSKHTPSESNEPVVITEDQLMQSDEFPLASPQQPSVAAAASSEAKVRGSNASDSISETERQERLERSDRPERPARPDRPARPERPSTQPSTSELVAPVDVPSIDKALQEATGTKEGTIISTADITDTTQAPSVANAAKRASMSEARPQLGALRAESIKEAGSKLNDSEVREVPSTELKSGDIKSEKPERPERPERPGRTGGPTPIASTSLEPSGVSQPESKGLSGEESLYPTAKPNVSKPERPQRPERSAPTPTASSGFTGRDKPATGELSTEVQEPKGFSFPGGTDAIKLERTEGPERTSQIADRPEPKSAALRLASEFNASKPERPERPERPEQPIPTPKALSESSELDKPPRPERPARPSRKSDQDFNFKDKSEKEAEELTKEIDSPPKSQPSATQLDPPARPVRPSRPARPVPIAESHEPEPSSKSDTSAVSDNSLLDSSAIPPSRPTRTRSSVAAYKEIDEPSAKNSQICSSRSLRDPVRIGSRPDSSSTLHPELEQELEGYDVERSSSKSHASIRERIIEKERANTKARSADEDLEQSKSVETEPEARSSETRKSSSISNENTPSSTEAGESTDEPTLEASSIKALAGGAIAAVGATAGATIGGLFTRAKEVTETETESKPLKDPECPADEHKACTPESEVEFKDDKFEPASKSSADEVSLSAPEPEVAVKSDTSNIFPKDHKEDVEAESPKINPEITDLKISETRQKVSDLVDESEKSKLESKSQETESSLEKVADPKDPMIPKSSDATSHSKPTRPARPARPSAMNKFPIDEAPEKPKPKPKPKLGSRIAALQNSGMFNDLNAAIGRGPPPIRKTSEPDIPAAEEQIDAMPKDARARARGPKRRLPQATKPEFETAIVKLWSFENEVRHSAGQVEEGKPHAVEEDELSAPAVWQESSEPKLPGPDKIIENKAETEEPKLEPLDIKEVEPIVEPVRSAATPKSLNRLSVDEFEDAASSFASPLKPLDDQLVDKNMELGCSEEGSQTLKSEDPTHPSGELQLGGPLESPEQSNAPDPSENPNQITSKRRASSNVLREDVLAGVQDEGMIIQESVLEEE